MFRKTAILLSLLAFLMCGVDDSFARVGGGKSSGFRTYKSQPSPQQAPRQDQSPARTPQQTPQQPLQKPSFFNSGIFKMLVGGLLIGGLFSLLAGHGFQFGAPGLLEILLIGGIIFLLFRRFSQKRQAAQYQYATGGSSFSDQATAPEAEHVRSPDVTINEEFIRDIARKTYTMLQEAWSRGDLSTVKNLMTVRMYDYLQDQLRQLGEQGLRNVVEVVYFENADIVETDEEGDKKVVVVQIHALLRDYTIDRNDKVVEGSKDTPVDAREYWAFVGKALDWKLDDIKQV
jgi:predicted lipid-binding transport protein (Tim44 family)